MKNSKVNTAWFKAKLADAKLSQAKLAKMIGLDAGGLSLTLRGSRKFQLPEIEKIASILGVPIAEVLDNIGVDTNAGAARHIPVIGTVDVDRRIRMKRPADGPRTVAGPLDMPLSAAALINRTDDFNDGWVMYYDKAATIRQDALGALAVVQIAGEDGWYLCVPKRGYVKGTHNLTFRYNGRPSIDGVRLASATPVLWTKHTA